MNRLLFTIALSLYFYTHALSQETDTIHKLEEVNVIYQVEKNNPISFLNLNLKQLKSKSTGQEPSFMLSETPSITVYSDAGNTQGYSYLRLRGIDQTRINMTLDEVPLNEPEDQGAYFSNYPDIFNSVSNVQIQRGVGTTQNGVASFVGSIQLSSPMLTDSATNTLGLSYASFNSHRAFAEYKSGLSKHNALYMRTSELHSDGYKYHSGNFSQSAFLSTGLFYPLHIWKLNVIAGHQRNQLAWLGVPDSLITRDRRTNVNENEKDNFTQCMIQLHNTWHVNSTTSLQSCIYYTYLKGNYDFNLNSYLGLPSNPEMYNYALTSNWAGFYSNYCLYLKHVRWTTGIHANMYNRKHIGSVNTDGQLYQNTGCKNEISTFSQINFQRGPLSFFGDIQYRHASFDYMGSVSFNKMQWNFFNPKLGICYNTTKNTTLYYSLGSSKREPTRNDIFGGNDNLLADVQGNPVASIKSPEYVLDQELGVRIYNSNFRFNANLYYMNFKNEIVLDGKLGPNGLALTNNVKQSFRTGIEVAVSWKIIKNVTYTNNSSFNYSKIRESNETFKPILTPSLILNQEITYQLSNLLFGISSRYQSKSFIDYVNTTTIHSYVLLNAHLEYVLHRFDIALFSNNISNKHYYNNGYVETNGTAKYFVQAPINFSLSITYHI